MLFLLFLCILVGKAVSQGVAIPVQTATGFVGTVTDDCGPCSMVAPIDQAIVGSGASYYSQLGYFTFGESGPIGSAPSFIAPTGSVLTYKGGPVTDPTAYLIFTSYRSVFQIGQSGTCTTVENGSMLTVPFSVQLPSGAASNIITQAEEVFVSEVGGITCNRGAPTVLGGTALPVTAITFTLSGATPTTRSQGDSTSYTVSNTSISNSVSHAISATPTDNNTSVASAVASYDSGLSTSAKLGLGIGIGVPGAIILVTIGALVWKCSAGKTHTKGRPLPLSELPSKEPDSLAELENSIPPQELENNIPPQELSVERRPELQ